MSEHKFEWLAPTSYPRRGEVLVQGKTYSVEAYGAAVVAEWVRTGAARYVADKKSKGGGEI